jgi:lipoate-protein ligase A
MPEHWLLLHSGAGEPAFNMALDEALLETMPHLQKPVLRFYSWSVPAASFGYFQKFAEVERITALRPLVRRPTAGGLVPHDRDWTYSLLFPPYHIRHSLAAVESYRRVHLWIQAAFAALGVQTDLALRCRKAGPGRCFVGYETSDVLWQGQKIAGAAQRRNRDGLLIQGSVQPPPLSIDRAQWEKAMQAVTSDECGASREECITAWQEFTPDQGLQERALELAAKKYSQPSFNQKR